MRELMAVLKALADENRVRVMMALDGRELCVCQIVELLELANSTVSKHMAILKHARLVESRKDGRWIYYRPADREASPEAAEAVKLLQRCAAGQRRFSEDQKRLKRILKIDPEVLCRQQSDCRC